MNYQQYQQLFDNILNTQTPPPPYDKEAYLNYTRLNRSRMRRWDKTMQLDEELLSRLQNLKEPQHWIIITEPWCGDAAHILPFLIRMVEQSPQLSYELQLRDSEPFLINDYLTRGGKSIPKLIARDQSGKDLYSWGPRPEGAQQLYDDLKAAKADFEATKIALQNWYNKDKGVALQKELSAYY